MNADLGGIISSLISAAARREEARRGAASVWRDQVFRDLDQRALSPLEAETRAVLAALTSADQAYRQALDLLS